ncbi:hypothetical protein ZIOFF_039438 [Zingiber officinale]|uniref:Uncharacterized protein n=1 Tax=Zingiber officinale TaxID=94328 RepID=A0A8J5GBL8_ZINOF|nr:hypothetical protein ZIOFF_039438 [Zingiber officinale]
METLSKKKVVGSCLSCSITVTAVDSGKKALELLGMEPNMNMINTYYWMPKMIGYKILKRIKDLLSKAISNFCIFIWTLELLPLDIIVLALIDQDDDPYALRIVIGDLVVLDIFAKIVGQNEYEGEKIPSTKRKGFYLDTKGSHNLLAGFLDSIMRFQQG